ncbi:hypothetical protein [Streptomyces sp. ISL-98]|uniref:hypothetical protein n=1 Tax=Streptomyces sp. ISL-98 TaxID=2819192 RepID=UPI001BE5EF60|nr:hypothetical protein [Streptomyces sp. ISL-98]
MFDATRLGPESVVGGHYGIRADLVHFVVAPSGAPTVFRKAPGSRSPPSASG